MRKLLTTLLMIIALIFIFNANAMALTAKVNTDGVRVRAQANTSSAIITTLDKDADVQVIDQENDWYKIKYEQYEGFIRKDLLTPNENVMAPKNNEDEKKEDKKEDNNESHANNIIEVDVHVIPTIYSSFKDVITKYENIQIIKEVNHWLYIQYGNNYGWVSKEKLDLLKNTQNTVDAETNKQKTDEKPEVQNNNEQNENETKQEQKQEENVQEPINNEVGMQMNTERTGYVSSLTGVNLRKESNTSSNILNTLDVNTEIKIIGEDGEWYKVKYSNDEGYIMNKYVSDEKVTVPVTTSSRNIEVTRKYEVTEDASEAGKKIAEFAMQFVGYPYVYGGTNPYTGADCTGFAYYVYNECGYNLSRSCSVQAQSGEFVEKENIQPGDLIIFNNTANTQIGHVGIYVGDGTFVHASNPERGIRTDSIYNASYIKRYVCTRRIV